ncbi:cytochrome P450 [Dichomitus squalens LYAD-421 SS1]|uniref:Cytochrome P450 n=1 Tax=Dichomitus squalens (strain LYAD-421) TaxID=732165 RepID=R7SP97_DICSQ|nr:cytochrome P450 [Dichomitus squalens LYAD-421 SS1]EJF57560.1 cytochrome P450 [Dichomitus squalens LYAD-421 SS1]
MSMSIEPQTICYASLGVFLVWYIMKWQRDPLHNIPTVGGPSLPIFSYITAFRFNSNGKALFEEGYKRYYNSVFKVALLDQWLVCLTGSKLLDELRKRGESELSFYKGIEDVMQTRFTMGPEIMDDPYHNDIIRDKLTHMLPVIVPEAIDELSIALPEYIPTGTADEWVEVSICRPMLEIVARLSNRSFVGAPLCREKEYLDIAIDFAIDINSDRLLLGFLPDFVKRFMGKFTSSAKRSVRRTLPYFKDVLAERRRLMKENGDDWPDKPNDTIQWILDYAVPRGYDDFSVVMRILFVNFGAIHTTGNSLTHALYDLASMPEYIQPLREEIDLIVATEGWTKNALAKMWKLDSFVKESQRINGVVLTTMIRKAVKDVVLVNGTLIPKGTMVIGPQLPTHLNEEYFPDAQTFDPFRFSRMREKEGEGMKHQFVQTSTEFVAFGHGKRACPGRFFAANEMKAIMAYIIFHYDLKIPGDGSRPKNLYHGLTHVLPDPNGKVLFRRRKRES